VFVTKSWWTMVDYHHECNIVDPGTSLCSNLKIKDHVNLLL